MEYSIFGFVSNFVLRNSSFNVMRIAIIDYGMGNLASVRRAFEVCGAQNAFIAEEPKALRDASHIVLPGVGAFADGMTQLKKSGWDEVILEAADKGVPLLGICLGMQLLAQRGHEGGLTNGLGIIPGEVKLMQPQNESERIPHVGWNEVYTDEQDRLFSGVKPGTDFYFVHSYHVIPESETDVLGSTPYCEKIVSAVKRKNVYGVQFHPEKSSTAGFQILKNFVSLSSSC